MQGVPALVPFDAESRSWYNPNHTVAREVEPFRSSRPFYLGQVKSDFFPPEVTKEGIPELDIKSQVWVLVV